MNTVGLIGFTISVSAAFLLGMLIENFRASIALRRRSKYKFRSRAVPPKLEEWSVNVVDAASLPQSEMFEAACRKIVQENPGKFE